MYLREGAVIINVQNLPAIGRHFSVKKLSKSRLAPALQ